MHGRERNRETDQSQAQAGDSQTGLKFRLSFPRRYVIVISWSESVPISRSRSFYFRSVRPGDLASDILLFQNLPA